LNNSQSEKITLERQAAEVFAQHYSQTKQCTVTFVSHNVPQKPDVTCCIGKAKIDLEIAHLYGSQAEAKHILGKSLDDKTLNELILLESFGDADSRLINALNRILANKAQKHYDSDEVWLVIRNANSNWHKSDVLKNLGKIQIPARHPFSQVWFIADLLGQTGMVQFY